MAVCETLNGVEPPLPLATPSSPVRNQTLSGKPRLAIIVLLTGYNYLGPYLLCSINYTLRRFLLIAPLRRLLAIIVSLSVQWAALGGTCVACTEMDMAADAVGESVGTGLQRVVATQAPAPEPAAALVDMPEARGIAGERSGEAVVAVDAGGIDHGLLAGQRRQPVRHRVGTDGGGEDGWLGHRYEPKRTPS